MKRETEILIESILDRIDCTAININWKSEGALPMLGERKSSFRGHGTEFFELDYYQPGDDIRHIDWAATARSGREKPLKIVYQEERQIETHVLVNIDSSMEFGTVRCSKRELAAEMAAAIFYCVNETRDRAGVVVYSRHGVEDEVMPSAVPRSLYSSLTSILETQAKQPSNRAEAASNSDGLFRALSILPAHRSLVVVVSDFINMTQTDWNQLEESALYHDVICVYVQDLRERELPGVGIFGCVYEVQDYDGGTALLWNNFFSRRAHARRFRKHADRIKSELARRHCEFVVVSTEESDDSVMPRILDLFGTHR